MRERLAQEVGIPVDELTNWVGIADLVRIKGIGPAYAQLLVRSGLVGNIQQFLHILGAGRPGGEGSATGRIADSEEVRLAAKGLTRQLRPFAVQNSMATRVPSIRELTEAVEEAAELRPRLVLTVPDDEDEFRRHVFSRAREAHRHIWKYSLAVIGVLAGILALIFVGMLIWEINHINEIATSGDVVESLGVQFARSVMYYGNLSLAIVVLLILLTLLLLMTVYRAVIHVLDTRVVLWLFNDPTYRASYQKITSLDLRREKKAGWWGLGIFALIGLGLVIYFNFTQFGSAVDPDMSGAEFVRNVSLPVAVGGVLLAIAICAPKLHFFLRELRLDPAIDEAGAQRYLIYYLAQIALLPIVVILAAQVVLPGVLRTHTYIYRTHIEPKLEANLLETRAEIAALSTDDESIQQRRDRMLDTFDEILKANWLDYGLAVTEEDTEVLDVGIPLALNIVAWLAFAAIALLFVLPYLVLGGWRRGLFYMLLLAASFFIENGLEKSAPTWFSLKARSVGSILIIASAVFANALFFDWLFERSTERKKACPGCQAQLDDYDVHCSVCGLVQP